MSLGPFDLAGEPFLILYICLFAAAIVAGLVIPPRLRPEGQARTVGDPDQLALLAGGRVRFGDTVAARLLASGAVEMAGRNSFVIARERPSSSPAETAVMALPSPARWRDISATLKSYAEPLERQMVAAGLLMSDSERSNLRYWATLPYLMLFAFGLTKLVIGDLRDRPIGYLTILLIFTALAAALRWFVIDRRTWAGQRALADARGRAERIRKAPASDEVGLSVALFGTAVLAGSGWDDFHKLRSAAAGGDAGSGSSSSSGWGGGGDGAGCGGGCGGCGGS
jgi:uncharacterized protein (TIGR04222 family)